MTNFTPGAGSDRHAYRQQASQHFGNARSSAYEFGPPAFGSGSPRGSFGLPVFNASGAGNSGAAEHQEIALLPGEEALFAADFTTSPIMRHIKSGVVVTPKRVIMRHPHYLLWLIKVGHQESSSPINKLGMVTVGRTLSTRQLIKAALCGFAGAGALLMGLPSIVMAPIMGMMMLLFGLPLLAAGAFFLWTARSLALIVGTVGGNLLAVNVEKPEYHDMITAGQLIQRLMLDTEPSAQSGLAGAPTASAPAVSTPVAQARTETVTRPTPPPSPPPAGRPSPNPVAPPSIWRG